MNHALEDRDWFVDNSFSAADIQLSFVPQVAKLLYGLEPFPQPRGVSRPHPRPARLPARDRARRSLRLRQLTGA
jgi:glutathione S-transferase